MLRLVLMCEKGSRQPQIIITPLILLHSHSLSETRLDRKRSKVKWFHSESEMWWWEIRLQLNVREDCFAGKWKKHKLFQSVFFDTRSRHNRGERLETGRIREGGSLLVNSCCQFDRVKLIQGSLSRIWNKGNYTISDILIWHARLTNW